MYTQTKSWRWIFKLSHQLTLCHKQVHLKKIPFISRLSKSSRRVHWCTAPHRHKGAFRFRCVRLLWSSIEHMQTECYDAKSLSWDNIWFCVTNGLWSILKCYLPSTDFLKWSGGSIDTLLFIDTKLCSGSGVCCCSGLWWNTCRLTVNNDAGTILVVSSDMEKEPREVREPHLTCELRSCCHVCGSEWF